jgi:hypothetical protein
MRPLYLALSGLAVVTAVLKAPTQPINDSALFEYFGRAMLHGERLYVDLHDNKLPGVYLINEFWNALFGSNYFLHTCAEGALAAATIFLFLLTLRGFGIEAWALGTFLFAAFFCLPYPQFNFTQHYAVFFIVLGLYLGTRRADVWAGIAIAVATTFWLPAILTCIPILTQRIDKRRRGLFAAGAFGLLLLGAAGALVLSSRSLAGLVAFHWSRYIGYSVRDNVLNFGFVVSHSAMIPSIVVLVTLLLIVVRRPLGEASRFALSWSACALAGSFIPPNFSEHYYLPAVPALAMAIASFGLKKTDFVRRPIVAAIAALALVVAVRQTVINAINVRDDAAYVTTLGNRIRDALGSGADVYTREYFPDIQLASDARNIGSLWLPGQPIPDVIVAGPRSLQEMVETRRPVRWIFGDASLIYDPACGNDTDSLIALYVIRAKASKFHCDDTRNPP